MKRLGDLCLKGSVSQSVTSALTVETKGGVLAILTLENQGVLRYHTLCMVCGTL